MTIGCNFANNCYWSWFECSGSWRRSLCMMWKCKLWTGSFSSFYQFLPGWLFSSFSLYFWGIFHQILHTVLPPKVGGLELESEDVSAISHLVRFGMSHFSRVFNFYVKTAGWSISLFPPLLLWLILYKYVNMSRSRL